MRVSRSVASRYLIDFILHFFGFSLLRPCCSVSFLRRPLLSSRPSAARRSGDCGAHSSGRVITCYLSTLLKII